MKKIHITFVLLALACYVLPLRSANGGFYESRPAAAPNPTILLQDTCLNKKFSVVFYIILDYANTLTTTTQANINSYVSTYQLSDKINKLNAIFSRLCVSFEHCKTVTIPQYTYNAWNMGETDSLVLINYYTPNVLNIYLPETIMLAPLEHQFGYSAPYPTATLTPRDYIVTTRVVPDAYLYHAIGHFFGLPHTWDEVTGLPPVNGIDTHELVNGSNSTVNGDGFEDTEADCYPVNFVNNMPNGPPCYYDYATGTQDANGDYFTPPVDNYMSAYPCRCRFSQLQYNAMGRNIVRKRVKLH